jgi:5,5'-dehydrodivanillate O-demethylase
MEPDLQGRPGLGRLTETAPDTLMGKLLRKFWHPIALAGDVGPGSAKPVRILSEDLTLYRGESGNAYLVGGRCAHRCTMLHTGWVKDDQIRCMYHGWRYDGTGLCTEIPAEKRARTIPPRIAGYPVHEYAGLIFAYLGEAPAPPFDLPRKDVFEDARRHVFAKRESWDCNWFQYVENSMDALHVSFAHMWGASARFGTSISAGALPELDYIETSSGIRQIATRSKDNVRVSDWTFPNNNHVVTPGPRKDSPWGDVAAWAVPVDDTHIMRFKLYAIAESDPAVIAGLGAHYDLGFEPLDHAERLFRGDLSGLADPSVVTAQDYVAVRGQGTVCDRSKENLSVSDAGVLFLRRIFLRELEAIRENRPTKHWSRLRDAVHLPPPPVQAAE